MPGREVVITGLLPRLSAVTRSPPRPLSIMPCLYKGLIPTTQAFFQRIAECTDRGSGATTTLDIELSRSFWSSYEYVNYPPK
jgi:hypothetical protein